MFQKMFQEKNAKLLYLSILYNNNNIIHNKDYVVHHCNYNKLDNTPRNLDCITKKKHIHIHNNHTYNNHSKVTKKNRELQASHSFL